MPARRYGGIAKDSSGKPASRAQIAIKLKPELLQELPMRFQTNIVTNEKGEWSSLPLPADATQLLISQTAVSGADKPDVTQLDATQLQLAAQPQVQVMTGKVTIVAGANGVPMVNGGVLVLNGVPAAPAVAFRAVAPVAGQPGANANLPSPEQAVVLDLHHPWVDASKWERNAAPNVYGIDMARPDPRINLLDSAARTMSALKLSIPIDAKQYPIVTFRYHAQNTSDKTPYVLRLAHGSADSRQIVKFFKADDLKADGEVHELTADLRQQQVQDAIVEATIGLWSDDKPAWLDVVGLSFSAAPDGQAAQKIADDPEIKLKVSTLDGTPLAGARVSVDAERANFTRSAETNDKGEVSIKPLGNESQVHMARIEKTGYMTIDRAFDATATEFKSAPAVRYGGVALAESGQAAVGAQVTVRAKSGFLHDIGLANLPLAIVTTDEKGHWSTPPLPADASLLTIQCRVPVTGGDPVVSKLDADKSQQPNEPWPVLAAAQSDTAVRVATTAKQPVAVTHATAKPSMEPITAIVQKVDDTTTGLGWTGIDGDQLLVVLHPQPNKDQAAKIPLMDITELMLKKSSSSSSTSTPAATTRPANVLPNAGIALAGDDRLLGTVAGWSDKKLSMHPNIAPAGTIEVPVSSLRELWCGTADQIKKARAVKEEAGLEDIAFATKDDDVIAVHGIVIGIEGDALHFRYDNADRKIGLNRLVGIVMAKAEDAPPDDTMYESVQFVNDDQISGKLIAIEGKDLSMQTRAGASFRVPIDQIAKISIRNGRLVYVSDLKPAKVEQTPYFDRMMEYRIDKSLTGRPITLSDGTYAHGISVHSRCVLTYNLDGRFNEFKSKVGFLLPEGKVGDCVIRVLGDGKPLFEKLDARGDQIPADLKLNVAGVHELTLEVDYGRNDDVGDRVAWANAGCCAEK